MGSILHFNIIDSFQVYRIGFISVMYEEKKIHIKKSCFVFIQCLLISILKFENHVKLVRYSQKGFQKE